MQVTFVLLSTSLTLSSYFPTLILTSYLLETGRKILKAREGENLSYII